MYKVKFIETCGTETLTRELTSWELEDLECDLDYEIISVEKVVK